MPDLIGGHEPAFWVAVVIAAAFKWLTSERQSWRVSLAGALSAVGCAWLFTDAVVAYLDWNPETYKAPTAAIIALMGENIMRSLSKMDLDKLVQIWKGGAK